jgi:spore maturation protein CgeB
MNGLAASLWKINPHVLLVVSGFFTDHDLLEHARRLGTRVILIATESPYEDDRQLDLAGHVDLVLLNDPQNLPRFREVTQAAYLPHAYRPSIHHPGPADPELACDVAMVGTGYPSRVAFLEAMDLDGLRVRLGGNWMRLKGTSSPLLPMLAHHPDTCMDNEDAAALYRSAATGINLYRREAAHPELERGWAMGPREVEMAACGLWFARDPRPEGDEALPMLPTFTSPAEASERLRWALAHPTSRARDAEKARAAIEDRTFVNHARSVLRMLTRAPATR